MPSSGRERKVELLGLSWNLREGEFRENRSGYRVPALAVECARYLLPGSEEKP